MISICANHNILEMRTHAPHIVQPILPIKEVTSVSVKQHTGYVNLQGQVLGRVINEVA